MEIKLDQNTKTAYELLNEAIRVSDLNKLPSEPIAKPAATAEDIIESQRATREYNEKISKARKVRNQEIIEPVGNLITFLLSAYPDNPTQEEWELFRTQFPQFPQFPSHHEGRLTYEKLEHVPDNLKPIAFMQFLIREKKVSFPVDKSPFGNFATRFKPVIFGAK